MKKKLAAIAMATAMAASLAACSAKPAETTAAAEENEETTAEAAEGSEAAEAGDSAFAGIIHIRVRISLPASRCNACC